MSEGVCIVGAGFEGFRPAITDVSTREMMYLAASKAYADASVDPRKDVDSFICCTEDFWEGWSITDEMVPDQVGGARRPVCTVPADGIIGMGHAVMHIRSGVADVVSVEAHSKVADVLDKTAVENLALDPVYHRPIGANSDVLAGLEMSAYMKGAGVTRADLSRLVRAEKSRALSNPRASYGGRLGLKEIGASDPVAPPLMRCDKAEFAEAGIVIVFASEKWAKKNKKDGIAVDGVTWRSSTPWYEGGEIAKPGYAAGSFKSVAKQAGSKGADSFDVLEVDDTYSYKLLQHLSSMGLSKSDSLDMVEEGRVNPSGGSIGAGHLIEATGSHKVLECVLQLRGEAGGNQTRRPKNALALSWRGNPTATGAAIAISGGR